MADFMVNRKILTINLSLFSNSDWAKSATKSPKSFEPNGVVGLGIVAAMNELDQNHKSSRAAILAVSPRSTPIPILSSAVKSGGTSPAAEEEMEAEEYTCVISHIGDNLIRKREYYDDILANEYSESTTTSYWASSGVVSASPPPVKSQGSGAVFQAADFLSSCNLCKKQLHGLDIFIYRGEKAFCSAECRFEQISMDERKEKYGTMKPLEYSVSPCSSPMQFFAGVAVA